MNAEGSGEQKNWETTAIFLLKLSFSLTISGVKSLNRFMLGSCRTSSSGLSGMAMVFAKCEKVVSSMCIQRVMLEIQIIVVRF